LALAIHEDEIQYALPHTGCAEVRASKMHFISRIYSISIETNNSTAARKELDEGDGDSEEALLPSEPLLPSPAAAGAKVARLLALLLLPIFLPEPGNVPPPPPPPPPPFLCFEGGLVKPAAPMMLLLLFTIEDKLLPLLL